mmetsp:Transcript_20142/g.47039  ORF Transcript_20142/g.47039 Transcript_20142/m.47039 type:complete len:453 (-) Transcript_20142:13652-15010(-)
MLAERLDAEVVLARHVGNVGEAVDAQSDSGLELSAVDAEVVADELHGEGGRVGWAAERGACQHVDDSNLARACGRDIRPRRAAHRRRGQVEVRHLQQGDGVGHSVGPEHVQQRRGHHERGVASHKLVCVLEASDGLPDLRHEVESEDTLLHFARLIGVQQQGKPSKNHEAQIPVPDWEPPRAGAWQGVALHVRALATVELRRVEPARPGHQLANLHRPHVHVVAILERPENQRPRPPRRHLEHKLVAAHSGWRGGRIHAQPALPQARGGVEEVELVAGATVLVAAHGHQRAVAACRNHRAADPPARGEAADARPEGKLPLRVRENRRRGQDVALHGLLHELHVEHGQLRLDRARGGHGGVHGQRLDERHHGRGGANGELHTAGELVDTGDHWLLDRLVLEGAGEPHCREHARGLYDAGARTSRRPGDEPVLVAHAIEAPAEVHSGFHVVVAV